jgi:U4/U6 small nuclear ribonucleoprotein PRP31
MYVESCMHVVAPNLCRLVGSSVASKLMSTAGGIDKLAVMPACNIQVLGSEKTPNLGIGMMGRNHMGFFGSMKMVKDAPNKHQIQLVRMLSTNVAKCARVDALRTCPSGNEGDKIREQLLERFEKIQEPGQSCLDKALPIPDEQPKKRRGGKRHRKRKEAMGMTEVNKYKNRMKFGEEEEENVDGMAMGMLGNMGKVRVNIKKTQKINPSKKLMEQLKKSNQSGMESSLAFASVQGIELMNPSNINLKKGTDTYFNR